MKEEWKDIIGFENYQVSNLGRVRSKDIVKHIVQEKREYDLHFKGKILSQKEIRGYKNVGLSDGNGKIKTKQVHRLVMTTFNPIDNMEHLQVNHKDCNKSNNNLENLEWTTPSENTKHASDNKLLRVNNQKGGKNKMSKLNEDIVKEIKTKLEFYSDKELAEIYGVCRQSINHIRLGKTWNHI